MHERSLAVVGEGLEAWSQRRPCSLGDGRTSHLYQDARELAPSVPVTADACGRAVSFLSSIVCRVGLEGTWLLFMLFCLSVVLLF